jgi:CubicO group peptidase (beta-lactamase class C family)
MNIFFLIATLWGTLVPGENPTRRNEINGNIELRSMAVATKFDSLFRSLSTKRGFNGNVLIGMSGNIVYKNAFGFSDLKKKTLLNVKSVFQIASISKQFTAIAVMMLHESGKLEYSDTIQKFIPDFPYKNITIKQLLSHRSGLPNYMYFTAKYWKKKKEYLTNEQLLEIMTTNKPRPEFLPDRRYKYSNTGYAMLALIVEHISGMPFDMFMETKVFHPLGMTSTFVYNPLNKKTNEYETNGYNRNRRKSYEDFLDGICGDKGIHSSVEDMFLWDQALYSERLVKQTTLDEAFTPMSYDYKRDNNYGYGFRIDTLSNGSKIVYHGGWWRGYNSLFVRRLDNHSTIIILCNKVNGGFGDIKNLMSIIDSPEM